MIELRFHHVGVGTVRPDDAIAAYVQLGYGIVRRVDDEVLDVRVALLAAPHSPFIEIVSPLSAAGPLKSFIERRLLPSPYHTCYATPSVDGPMEELREHGFLPIMQPTPAKLFDGARIVYLYHPALGLLELLEAGA
jgi:methylmalonyl-CoA/ethylmalonyl-CoA epimerase